MRRRDFITVMGTAATSWPLAALAQQTEKPVIGFLDGRFPDAIANRLRGFHRGLRETGYVEGENVTVLYRYAENQVDRLPALAAELTRPPIAVIVASGGPNVSPRPRKQPRRSLLFFSVVKIQPGLGLLRAWRIPEAI